MQGKTAIWLFALAWTTVDRAIDVPPDGGADMKTSLGLKAWLAQDVGLLMILSSSPMIGAHGLGVAGGDGAFCSVGRFEGIPENGKPENRQNNTY